MKIYNKDSIIGKKKLHKLNDYKKKLLFFFFSNLPSNKVVHLIY